MAAQRSSNVFSIEVDGKPLTDDVADTLLEAWVEDEVNLPDTFELVFRDPLRKVLASGGFEIGKKLAIKVVSEADAGGVAIVEAEITAVEAEIERQQTLTIVRGYDLSHRLQRGTNTETHLDSTYGDIAGKDRRAPQAVQGRRRAQLGHPRSGRAVEPDRLGVPHHAGQRDRPRGRRRRRQAALPRAGRLRLRTAEGRPRIGRRRASSSPVGTCSSCGRRSAGPSRSRRSPSADGTTRPRRRSKARLAPRTRPRSAKAGQGAADLAEQARRRHPGAGRSPGRRAPRWPRKPPSPSSSSSPARRPSSTAWPTATRICAPA